MEDVKIDLPLEKWQELVGKPVKIDDEIVGEVLAVFKNESGDILTKSRIFDDKEVIAIICPKGKNENGN